MIRDFRQRAEASPGIAKVGNIELFSDYGGSTLGEASASLIKDLHLAGLVSGPTAIVELQRRGIISDDVDPDVEFEAASSEVPAPLPLAAPQPGMDSTTAAVFT